MASSGEVGSVFDSPICFEKLRNLAYIRFVSCVFNHLLIHQYETVLETITQYRLIVQCVDVSTLHQIKTSRPKNGQNNCKKNPTNFWPLQIRMKKAIIQRVRFFVTLVHKTGSKLLQHFDENNVEITCVRHVASLSIKG